MPKKTISLGTAVLVCLNTMMGAGAFINLKQLSFLVNKWGFLLYLIAALAATPLVFCAGILGRKLPVSGGMYVYSKTFISKNFGFLSGWGYFVGKTVSSSLLAHLLAAYIKTNITGLSGIPMLLMDYLVISLVFLVSALGAISNKHIQMFVTTLKIIPFIFVFSVGFASFNATHFIGNSATASEFFLAIPSALYALVGFEIISAIGGLLENPEKNIQRSIFIAFGTVVVVYSLLQLFYYGALGPLGALAEQPLADLGGALSPRFLTFGKVANGIFLSSVFGSTIAMMSGNSWNLHTLANNNHFPAKKLLTKVNNYNMPTISLFVEALIACLILTITQKFVPLQNMTIFALFVSSGLTALSTFKATKNDGGSFYPAIAIAAMGVCLVVLGAASFNIYRFGLSISFLSIFLSGWSLALYKGLTYSEERNS